jgi:hypothetical protein
MHSTPQPAGPTRRTFLRSLGAVAVTAVSVPTLAAEPAKKAEDLAGWKSLFDGKALGAWKSADFHKPGKVLLRDGAIVMEKGGPFTTAGKTRPCGVKWWNSQRCLRNRISRQLRCARFIGWCYSRPEVDLM